MGKSPREKNSKTSVWSYEYDELGQLTRENNADSGKTTVYNYDGYGNITGKRVYNYTTSQSLSGLSYTAVNYTYGFNTGYWSGLWGDLLKSYNGQQISYDEVGNPVEIGSDISLYWTQGRLLSSYEETDGEEVHYKYNADGIRTSKTVNGVEHRYTLNGTQVLSEEWTEGSVQHLMIYVYDAEGSPIGFRYRNSTYIEGYFKNYIYGKNVLGDVLYVFNLNGDKVAEFTYDAWGYPESELYYYSSANPGVEFSPFRYRGYWYDAETKLYYLNSRYYNPDWGRFISPDSYLNANGDLIGFNLYAYCSNEPIIGSDSLGTKKEHVCLGQEAHIGAYVIIDKSKIPFAGHALLLYEYDGHWYKTQFFGSYEAMIGDAMYSILQIHLLRRPPFTLLKYTFLLSQIGTTIAEITNEKLDDDTNIISYILDKYPGTTSDYIGLPGDYSYIFDKADKIAGYRYYNLLYRNCAHYVEYLLLKDPEARHNTLKYCIIPKSLGEALR